MSSTAVATGADALLSNLFSTMVHELKTSSTAWENVCVRASKLSAQLVSMAGSLSNFVDAVQGISDNANNIKGASRDIGAALTRFCMRQKSLENIIRSLANALNDQFVVALEKKSVEWKQRVGEIERRRQRSVKKTRQHMKNDQGSSGSDNAIESRNSYSELLFEQRSQFVFFVNALLPVMNIEVNLLDEGTHVRQVRDSIESVVNDNDTQCIIQALLEDLGVNVEEGNTGDSATWHRKMISASKSTGLNTPMVEEYSTEHYFGAPKFQHNDGSLSPTSSTLSTVWPGSIASSSVRDYSSPQNTYRRPQACNSLSSSTHSQFEQQIARPHTISASEGRRVQLSSNTFQPPATMDGFYGVGASPVHSPSSKPPLPKRQISAGVPGPGGYSVPCSSSTQRTSINSYTNTTHLGGHHPLSISANDLTSGSDQLLRHPSGSIRHASGASSRPLSLSGCTELEEMNFIGYMAANGKRNQHGDRCSTSLIAETLQQIDQLGVELDSYCQTLKPSCTKGPLTENGSSFATLSTHTSRSQAPPSSLALQPPSNGVRYRPDIRPPPPLPQRRNSTITAATPTAPSIADVRGTSACFYQQAPTPTVSSPNGLYAQRMSAQDLRVSLNPNTLPPPSKSSQYGHSNSQQQHQKQRQVQRHYPRV